MNFLILLFSLFTFSNADYLFIKNNHCVTNLSPYSNHSGVCYSDLSNNKNICDTELNIKDDFIDGFDITNGLCSYKNDLEIAELSKKQWSESMSILAHFVGFTMLFLVSFLSVLVVRR